MDICGKILFFFLAVYATSLSDLILRYFNEFGEKNLHRDFTILDDRVI